MSSDKAVQESFEQLQYYEHSLQQLLAQKQHIQIEHAEIENATREVTATKGAIFKMVGGVMVQTEREPTLAELGERMKQITSHLEAIQKQEKALMEQAHAVRQTLQKAVAARTPTK
jgi:prefoldin beta subunit